MRTQWKKFDRSQAQIDEMRSAKHGWIYRDFEGRESDILYGVYMHSCIKEYLICSPLPHAAMIARHASTGQPVYFKYEDEWLPVEGDERVNPFWHPDDEFSFNQKE